MLPVITSTHAVPRRVLSAHISIRSTLVVCPHCFETLGSAPDLTARKSIELRHKCREKTLAEQPAISIPFS